MPVGYGSNFKLPALSTSEVGITLTERGSSPWISFLRIFITVAEIGAGFIPGIGAAAETGIGLTAGAINQVLDIESGNVSALGTFLNFATPFIGGGFAGLSNIRGVGRLVRTSEDIGQELGITGGVVGAIISGDRRIVGSTFSQLNRGITGVSRRIVKSSLSGSLEGLASVNKTIKNIMAIDKAAITSLKVSDNIVREVGEDTRYSKYLKSLGFTAGEIAELLKVIGKRVGQTEATEGLLELRSVLRNIAAKSLNRGVKQFAKQFEAGLTAIEQSLVEIPVESAIYRAFEDASISVGKLQSKAPWYKRLWKYTGTSDFNQKYVQKAQLIDPNDLGRAPVEALYQKVKSSIYKWLNKVGKAADNFEKLDELWTKTGGLTFAEKSSWIYGIKRVIDLPDRELIMIRFKPEATSNKRPVLVWGSKLQVKRFIASDSPGSFYLKNWATSRGGKPVGLTGLFGGIGFTKSGRGLIVNQVLGFIPVQQLRNILSIVSNWVENIHDMNTGDYQKNYFKKLKASFINTAVSRTFRIFGKVIGGGVAGKYFGDKIGRFVGAELQRVGTQILGRGVKNAIAGKSFGTGLKQAAIKGALVSIRSNALRGLRGSGRNSVIVNTLTARRKLQTVKRIPNAMLPGRPFKGFKI